MRGASAPHRPTAVAEHYRSVDSIPERYARDEPPARVLGFLVTFAAVELLVQVTFTDSSGAPWAGTGNDLILFVDSGQTTLIPARLFVLPFFAVFAFWIDTNFWRRLLIAVELVGGFMVAVVLIDWAASAGPVHVEVLTQQVVSSLWAFALFPLVLNSHALLPPPGPVPPGPRPLIPWYLWVRISVVFIIALTVSIWVESVWLDTVTWMRSTALLGGVGPGVFLVQQLFVLQAAVIGIWLVVRSRRAHPRFTPDIGILVPAFNEAHSIGATIASVGRAGRAYAGAVHLYVVDNGSIDGTAAIARAAIDAEEGLSGEVLECHERGKAVALNYALSFVREDFGVRIDADTVIPPGCLEAAMRHLADPEVGAVGGLPMPIRERTFFDRFRVVEVLMRHSYNQVALSGIRGLVGVPGMFTAYRRAAQVRAGALAEGMNGEDTDICLRMTTAGYRVVMEPAAVYHTETPQTWGHLREQRLRWFRSAFHVVAHCQRAIRQRPTLAGAVTLPFQILNASRRAMLGPILIAGTIALLIFPETFPAVEWAAIVATVLGLQFLITVTVCLLSRRPRALLYIPEYLLFRVIRSYFTLEALLSLVYPPFHVGRRKQPGP